MSPQEVAARARASVAHRVDDAMYRARPSMWSSRWEPSPHELLTGPVSDAPHGFLTAERAVLVRDRLPGEADALTARADEVVAGRFRFFGYPEVRVADGGTPDVDPFSGRAWPERHGKLVDYRHRAVGDPKWIWELNRCQELPLLVGASLLTGRAGYSEIAARRLLAWISSHPPGRGIAWTSGFEAGVRSISLALTYDALRGSNVLDSAEHEVVARSLWQHARFIQGDLSRGSSANNHLVGELAGLAVMGCLAPELEGSERWLAEAVDALQVEAHRQIRPDGTGVEQAFTYHVFVVELLLVVTAALDSVGHSVPDPIAAGLERSGDALWAQLGPGEPAPTYGDTDDGRALVLDGRELRDARGVAASIAARFGHGRAASVAGELDATALWLFGARGAAAFARLAPSPDAGSVVLPDGGLTILRSGRMRATVDHGPHGHLSIAAHAHADALCLDVSVGEEGLVVDPGVGSYFARPAVRDAFRGTAFHATVVVDGRDSSVAGGPFLWTTQAASRQLAVDVDGGLVVVEHDGYRRLDDPVLHRRAVVVLDEAVLVVDTLLAGGRHSYAQRWPLHPELDLDERENDRVVARRAGVGLVLAVTASAPMTLTAARGERDPWNGWWSPRLESVIPAWSVAAELAATGRVEIAALVVPFHTEAAPDVGLELLAGGDRTRVVVRTPAGEHGIALDLASDPVDVQRVAPALAAR
jgi:uncharacterized heparinase superfamily protein